MAGVLRDEMLCGYVGSRDDPEILEITKGPIFEEWESFSIVSKDIYYFRFDSEEVWLDNFERLS
jgi:hypothetical protein